MNKIPVDFICFPFSESGDSKLDSIFYSWEEAEKALSSVIPPDLGYYKTDFVITYKDGETYQGRFDIGSDAPTLKEHIFNSISCIKNNKYGRYKKETVEAYSEFENKYQIGA